MEGIGCGRGDGRGVEARWGPAESFGSLPVTIIHAFSCSSDFVWRAGGRLSLNCCINRFIVEAGRPGEDSPSSPTGRISGRGSVPGCLVVGVGVGWRDSVPGCLVVRVGVGWLVSGGSGAAEVTNRDSGLLGVGGRLGVAGRPGPWRIRAMSGLMGCRGGLGGVGVALSVPTFPSGVRRPGPTGRCGVGVRGIALPAAKVALSRSCLSRSSCARLTDSSFARLTSSWVAFCCSGVGFSNILGILGGAGVPCGFAGWALVVVMVFARVLLLPMVVAIVGIGLGIGLGVGSGVGSGLGFGRISRSTGIRGGRRVRVLLEDCPGVRWKRLSAGGPSRLLVMTVSTFRYSTSDPGPSCIWLATTVV